MSAHTEHAAMVQTTIDGRTVEVQRDRWALDVAREMGIEIPTMCHHAALAPYGACRLCVVEVARRGWTHLTTSCDLPIREGLAIRTDTPKVRHARKVAVEMMRAAAPDAEEVAALAEVLGAEEPRFPPRRKHGKCILCGLCVRVCERLLGSSAIGFSHRGAERRVGSPFDETSPDCIGCLACRAVCPTDCVRAVDEGDHRSMVTWHTQLDLARCEQCGTPVAPVKQLEFIRQRLPEPVAVATLCRSCRRSQSAGAAAGKAAPSPGRA